ncbi:unnamed protein product [Sphagnum balticum]
MDAGKPMKQSLAIAYSVKRKAPKKAMGGKMMAEGGPVSASDEKRPMPDNKYNDSKMAAKNSGDKAPKEDEWSDKPTEKQAVMNNGRKVMPIKRPKMVPSDAFSVKLYDDEAHLQDVDAPASPKEQPPEVDNELDAKKMGKSPDMAKPHTTRKAYAEGGMASGSRDEDEAKRAKLSSNVSEEYGSGPEEDMQDDPAGLESDDDMMRPAENDYMSMRDAAAYADGGEVSDEEEIEHAASIAAAIMMKMKKKMMAEGGAIKSMDSMDSDDSSEADLSRNADEDANMEDQSSFNALRKENYSESAGLNELDSPEDSNEMGDSREDDAENIHDSDIVSAIRRKMKIKSALIK